MEPGHFHLHLHPISKRKGHRIHAAVAYRHGTREITAQQAAAYRHAQETGKGLDAYDYRHKIGVQWFGIFAPKHAPDWCRNPRSLWAAVDATEHRSNARLAQEIILALPHQVGFDEHLAMLREFVTTNCVDRYAMVADVAIHLPPRHGDIRNVHAHILLTDRPITDIGFARTKDRRYQDRELVNELRDAWEDCHNRHMQRLGLPHRIDHRSLEAQRQEALRRNDTITALDLDREPQIHVGKALYATHPDHTIYLDRRQRNEAILTRNKNRAELRVERMRSQIAKADHATHEEARQNAFLCDTYELDVPSYDELHKIYGRPSRTSRLGRLKDIAFAGEVTRQALAIQDEHGHPWFARGNRPGAPSLLDVLLPKVARTGPGHPVFTVTAKDLAFCFYSMGLLTRRQLQNSLSHIALEEERLFADRQEKRKERERQRSWAELFRLPTPKADELKQMQAFALVPEGIYAERLSQVEAFRVRHRAAAQGRRKATPDLLAHSVDHRRMRQRFSPVS